MNFSHKLRKAFSPKIVASALEHAQRTFYPVNSREILDELENDPSWENLRQRYPRALKEVHRFADTRFWIKRNVERAQDLALPGKASRHILDLGCGPGYFIYVARKLGHTGVGLDIDEQPIFRETLQLLNVERIVHRIQSLQPLPKLEKRFDLITSYLTCFHRHERLEDGNWRTWSPDEWQFFINDLRANQLTTNGTVLLEFHPQKNGKLYSAEVRELFLRNGARLFRSRVFIPHSTSA